MINKNQKTVSPKENIKSELKRFLRTIINDNNWSLTELLCDDNMYSIKYRNKKVASNAIIDMHGYIMRVPSELYYSNLRFDVISGLYLSGQIDILCKLKRK